MGEQVPSAPGGRGHILLDRAVLVATAGFGVVAFALLLWRGLGGTPREAVAAGVYGMTLAASSVVSLVYNTGFKANKASLWRFADHICIFLLIAGTYTPLSMLSPERGVGMFLIPVWGVAAVGIGLKLWFRLRHDRWFILLYLGMGWLVLFRLDRLLVSFPATVLTLVAAGGLAFSAGVIFYALDTRWRWGGAIWHAAVLVGSATHFIAIFGFVLPMG